MDKVRRKVLKEQYNRIKTYMGVIQITNLSNGKIFIASYPNLKNKWMSIKSQLDMGRFANLKLQKDWNELGSSFFTYKVLEEKETDEISDVKWEVKQIIKPWLIKLEPFEDKGYNKPLVK